MVRFSSLVQGFYNNGKEICVNVETDHKVRNVVGSSNHQETVLILHFVEVVVVGYYGRVQIVPIIYKSRRRRGNLEFPSCKVKLLLTQMCRDIL